MQFDMTMIIIWWVVPLLLLLGRAGLQAYRTKQKKQELEEIESKTTPFTRQL